MIIYNQPEGGYAQILDATSHREVPELNLPKYALVGSSLPADNEEDRDAVFLTRALAGTKEQKRSAVRALYRQGFTPAEVQGLIQDAQEYCAS